MPPLKITMEPEYNAMLLPIITAVMLAYNRPVTTDEITDTVMAMLNSQRDHLDSKSISSPEPTSDPAYAKLRVIHKGRK
ncbi:uncharacterized protein LOC108599306 [Drosophila busckii]|uniref:uncharacterized protein LOC108599306 n=1 Tax=Drosophila busckii TaxID=30019 RepID=UPI00083F1A48|nr:uncharacterized protein LOC108599306 [Drosophila busckii]